MELENVGATAVNFNNAQWQIAVKQSPILTTPSTYYGSGSGTPAYSGEMRLTLTVARRAGRQLIAHGGRRYQHGRNQPAADDRRNGRLGHRRIAVHHCK